MWLKQISQFDIWYEYWYIVFSNSNDFHYSFTDIRMKLGDIIRHCSFSESLSYRPTSVNYELLIIDHKDRINSDKIYVSLACLITWPRLPECTTGELWDVENNGCFLSQESVVDIGIKDDLGNFGMLTSQKSPHICRFPYEISLYFSVWLLYS